MQVVNHHHPKIFKWKELIGLSNRLEIGRWSSGRPVFKKVDGETRFLIVAEGSTTWTIQKSTTDTSSWIRSGRATNSPSSPEAGPSVMSGVTRWRYWDSVKSIEGDISVTCLFLEQWDCQEISHPLIKCYFDSYLFSIRNQFGFHIMDQDFLDVL